MTATIKINWKNENKKEKLRGLGTLTTGLVCVSIKIFYNSSKKSYFISYPSYYDEKKEKYVNHVFPVSKDASKMFQELLEKALKDGKQATITIGENMENTDDSDDSDIPF